MPDATTARFLVCAFEMPINRASEFDLSLALALHRQQHIADPSSMRADAVIYPSFAMSLPIAAYVRAAQEKGFKL